ncbi:MAG: hypothetical protein U1E26_07525 [Coriobacteriia bacterium]|nr:hypothetical protein [Coriobacteriia bacterium]
MARTQTLIWTALPTGLTKPDARGNQKLLLSVFMSPRLATTQPMGVIAQFPDFEDFQQDGVNWAATSNGLSFAVETSNAASPEVRRSYAATRVSAAAEPALWDSFFGPNMPIKRYEFKNFAGVAMKTFATTSVFNTLKQQYVAVGATPSLAYKVPTIAKLINIPGVVNPPFINILPTPIIRTSAITALAAAPPRAQSPAFNAFEQFHRPYDIPDTFVAPPIPPMDFHRAFSALGSYPALMRRLGFVVDVQVPFNSAMAGTRRVRVKVTWPDGRAATSSITVPHDGQTLSRRDAAQWTAVDMAVTRVAPRRVTKFRIASRDGYVRDGYLVARSITKPASDPVKLYNVDVDLAASRLVNTAVNASDIINKQLVTTFGASAVEEGRVSASQVLAVANTEPMGLPALGQPVIRMAVGGLSDRVKAQFQRSAQLNAQLLAGLEDQTVNYAEDLTRGYRIDVWDSATRQWHRLCGRIGTYSIGKTPIEWSGKLTFDDEGWVQLGGVSRPQDVHSDAPPNEMRIHESVFDWGGWSLAAPRPGVPLSEPDGDGVSTPKDTFTDPDGNESESGHYLHPDLPLDVRFKVPPGDLPRLRFGTTYRFRARAVDLAGNSVPFTKGTVAADPGGSGDSNPLVSRAITHKRYDPVKPPMVVPVAEPKPSESPFVIVVRSYHDPVTGSVVTEDAARHITPPRVSVNMVEACGGLETSASGRPLDPALWSVLAVRDAYDPPQKPDGSATPVDPIESPVPYLPDRYARGAAFAGLPGVAQSLTPRSIGAATKVSGVRIPLSSTSSTTVASFRVGFEQSGAPWYDRLPFRFTVKGIEGTDGRLPLRALPKLPTWADSGRRLGIQLPKADEYVVGLSSYLNASDLQVMGVHQWTMEKYVPKLAMPSTIAVKGLSASATPAAAPKINQVPVAASASLSAAANALINVGLIGQNWLLSPKQELTLIHAVDQPMISPLFTNRAHMERKAGETHATLIDWMQVHGKSTVKVDVDAEWTENVDDTAKPAPLWGPTAVKKKAPAFNLTCEKNQTRVLNCGQSLPGAWRGVAWGVVPTAGMLVHDRRVDTKPQRQHFGDTKHRKVTYRATYATRFEKFFADKEGLTYTLTSPPKDLHVPSSARPVPPSLVHIMPTFGWERKGTTSTRKGGGLRVYLNRPWFSSGDDEKLGVVLYQQAAGDAGWKGAQPFVTQWGGDPLWTTPGKLPAARPPLLSFKGVSRHGFNLKLREYAGANVRVAGYDVEYDSESKLWFADIVVDPGSEYFPFIKLALARYQPYSLPGLELSSVVVADFVQLTPERYANMSVAVDGLTVTVAVTGHSYSGNDANKRATVTMQFEKLIAGRDANIGWADVGDEVELTRLLPTVFQVVAGDTRTTWRGTAKLSGKTASAQYRVVLREYEWFKERGPVSPVSRLVYTETIPLA